MQLRARRANPHMRALYVFNVLSLIGGGIYGLYYGVFLYKQTFSLSILAIDGLLGGFGAWLGYMAGVLLIRRFGYSVCLKFAFGLWAAIAFLTALVAGHIADCFMLLAVLKALPAGIYAATCDAMMLREVGKSRRDGFLQIKLAFEFIVSIILPSLVGALVQLKGGYQLAFVLAGIVYLAAFAVRIRLPKPNLSFDIGQVLQIFRRPLYVRHAANRTMAAGFNQLNAFVLTIIPFLLLKNELKIGLLTSVSAIAAAVVSVIVRKLKTNRRLKYGYSAYSARSIISFIFICSWSAPILMVWQLVGKLATPLHDPLQQGLDIHNDSLIMGEEARTQALHINVLNNTLLLIGTTVAYGAFYFITRAEPAEQRTVLQVLIMAYAAWRFINLAVSSSINKQAQRLGTRAAVLEWRPSLWELMQYFVRNQFMRARLALAYVY